MLQTSHTGSPHHRGGRSLPSIPFLLMPPGKLSLQDHKALRGRKTHTPLPGSILWFAYALGYQRDRMKLLGAVSSDCSVITVSTSLAAAVPARQTSQPRERDGLGTACIPRSHSPLQFPIPDFFARCMHAYRHTHTHTQLFRLLFGKQRLIPYLWKADSGMLFGHKVQETKYFLILGCL